MLEMLECINPKLVNEADYLAYLDHNGRPEFEAHLQECAYCQKEVSNYRQLDNLMHLNFRFNTPTERLGRMCIEPQQLGEYNLGLLDSVEAKRVANHLSSCEFCTAEYNQLRAWLPEPDLATPPVVNKPESKAGVWARGWLRRVEAVLQTITQPQGGLELAGALRSSGLEGVSLNGMPQTYQAEEVQVTVSVETTGQRRSDIVIMGQVLHDNYELDELRGKEVRLLYGAETVATEEIDDTGNFVFENIAPSKEFGLELTLPDKVIVISSISLN